MFSSSEGTAGDAFGYSVVVGAANCFPQARRDSPWFRE